MTTLIGTSSTTRRRRAGVGFAGRLVGIALLLLVAWALAADAGHWGGHVWAGDYGDLRNLALGLLASITEPQFYAAASASAGLLMGGAFAHLAHQNSWPWRGFLQTCGTGLWPWAVGSALLSLLLSYLLWGWTLVPGTWQPLFVPLVSVAPAMVVLYGPGRLIGLTAAVIGAVLTTPISIAAIEYVCKPLDLPLVVGATTGMWVGALVAFALVRFLPWMPAAGAWRTSTASEVSAVSTDPTASRMWVPRRVLADFTEAQFFGNEWASAAMILGAFVAYAVSPSSLTYGTGMVLAVLASQASTSLVGVVIWRRQWQALGFYPTFVPVVSVAPAAVLAYGGTIQAIVVGALAGALIAPPVAAAISRRLPAAFHPFIGNVASMCICTALIVPVLEYVPGVAS